MLRISAASSDEKWISFSANKHTSRAIRHKNGEITTETVSGITPPSNWSTIKITNIVANFLFQILAFFTVYIFPFIKGYWLNPMIKNHEISLNYYLISIPFLVLITIISIFLIVIKDKKGTIRKNHGAEHKILAAYSKLEHIPTVDEAKNFSRISRACGATIYSALITGQLIGFFIFINYGIMIPEKVLFLIPMLFHSIFPFNFGGKLVQFITTTEPNDENLELAITALTELMLTEDPGYFSIHKIDEGFLSNLKFFN